MFASGYDGSLFYRRDVEHAGSCGYEAISDQLYGDRGLGFQAVKDSLLQALKGLAWAERQVYAVACFPNQDTENFRDASKVRFQLPCVSLTIPRSGLVPFRPSTSRALSGWITLCWPWCLELFQQSV